MTNNFNLMSEIMELKEKYTESTGNEELDNLLLLKRRMEIKRFLIPFRTPLLKLSLKIILFLMIIDFLNKFGYISLLCTH